MTYKWDAEASEIYAKELAAKICEENFVDTDALDGEQILAATPIKQVNLLAIRLLYSRWQEETRRLQSPYFDYNHPEVQYALNEFMNVLSEFIAVRQREFEPLLVDAFTNTLKLALNPKEYFSQLLRDLPNFRLSAKWVKGNRSYFQFYKSIFETLYDTAEAYPGMYANEVIDLVNRQLDQQNVEDPTELMQTLDNILPIPISLRVVEKSERAPQDRRSSGKSFFDSIVEEKLTDRIRQHAPTQPNYQQPEITPKAVDFTTPSEVPNYGNNKNTNVTEEILPQRAVITPAVNEKSKNEAASNINEQHINVTQSLNDRATTTAMVTDYHRLSRVDSIRKSISLNQRFLFTKYLFNGNADMYNNSLDELDLLTNYTDARSFVVNNYVPRFNWDVKSSEVDEFFEILKRRFS